METAFQPSEAEQYSAWVVNTLLFSGLAIFISLPLISIAIAYFYYDSKHPWSSFLNESWSEDPHPPNEVISKFDITKELVETELDNLTQLLKDKGFHQGEDGIFEEIERLKKDIAELWAEELITEGDLGEVISLPEEPAQVISTRSGEVTCKDDDTSGLISPEDRQKLVSDLINSLVKDLPLPNM